MADFITQPDLDDENRQFEYMIRQEALYRATDVLRRDNTTEIINMAQTFASFLRRGPTE